MRPAADGLESAILRAASIQARMQAFARTCRQLQRRGEVGFSAAVDQKAVRDAVAVALTLEVAAESLGYSPWVFPGVRDVTVRLQRGESFLALLHDVLGTREASSWAHTGTASRRRCRVASPSVPTGGHLSQAVGFARALSMDPEAKARSKVVALLDASAVDSPDFHSALNFAGVWSSPVLFLALGTNKEDVLTTLEGYGVEGEVAASKSGRGFAETVAKACTKAGPYVLVRDTAQDEGRLLSGDRIGDAKANIRREAEAELAAAYEQASHALPVELAHVQGGVLAGI